MSGRGGRQVTGQAFGEKEVGLVFARPEKSRTDSDHGRPFGDRQREIISHSHREGIELVPDDIFPLLEKLAAPAEGGPNLLRVIDMRTDRHQSGQADVGQVVDAPHQFKTILRRDTELLAFPGAVNLDKTLHCPVQLGGAAIDFLGQFQRIDRLDHVEQLYSPSCFIGLEMANQVKTRNMADIDNLRLRFLHTTFPNIMIAGSDCCSDYTSRVSLGDGDHCDIVSITIIQLACFEDSPAEFY